MRGCPMSLKGLECQVSKLDHSDTRPRPTTGRAAPRFWRPGTDADANAGLCDGARQN
jgi:hypothetical protein